MGARTREMREDRLGTLASYVTYYRSSPSLSVAQWASEDELEAEEDEEGGGRREGGGGRREVGGGRTEEGEEKREEEAEEENQCKPST
eukprot:5706205-Pyramimonas_sp.AAC.1